jgi:hypothetical protein
MIKFFTKRNELKIQKIDLGNLVVKHAVIHDALKVFVIKLQIWRYWLFRRYWHWKDYSKKIVKLRRFFQGYWQIWRYLASPF